MYLEQLKSGVPTERGVRLTFTYGNKEKTIKLVTGRLPANSAGASSSDEDGTPEERLTSYSSPSDSLLRPESPAHQGMGNHRILSARSVSSQN